MNKKKIAGMVLSLSLVAGALAGCGGSDKGSSSDSGGKDDKVIKIGANLELSGGVASYGQSIREGVNLAFEEINKEESMVKSLN